MKLILRYMKRYTGRILMGMAIKLSASVLQLLIPYVMEHLIDDVAQRQRLEEILLWGGVMLLLAIIVRTLNIVANRNAVRVAQHCTWELRRDLFRRTLHLSGHQTDSFGLPSLISRMTSDSYNIQDFVRSFQTMGVRAPILLFGGIIVTMSMDTGLASILCILAPLLLVVVIGISFKGIPMYNEVQVRLDRIVRIMRENITGIRVVKALSKEDYERRRFGEANEAMTRQDRKAGIVMSLPGPIMTLALNVGLTIVVLVGARRVNDGLIQPGVILAFLTYFNMILMGVMGLTRIFLLMSKANASANRVDLVLQQPEDLTILPGDGSARDDSGAAVRFDHVSFAYQAAAGSDTAQERLALKDITLEIPRGGSLGIIGATGCGKTTLVSLLMRFYDPTSGKIYVNGRDVRSYPLDELRGLFGVVHQNDAIFADTLKQNILLGREVSDEDIMSAARDARSAEFIEAYEEGLLHEAAIHGANLSGGQKQRLLITRALIDDPEILILDDASSALDYRTDAALRHAIREHHAGTTTIVIAQRISSIMSLDRVLYLEEGAAAGYGTHEELMRDCPAYREIYDAQMGEED